MDERRVQERKNFSYYMRLMDVDTQDPLGHLADISSGGFKLDSEDPIPTDKDYRVQMELTTQLADKPSMTFIARCKWCKVDRLDPFNYNVGFQLINISSDDKKIINRMIGEYGKAPKDEHIYLRRTNLW
ncbi:MAG: PilZ domain-containing protein [Anaerolineae bacterium]|nr:PilZ domain-containing protein [Anaerolineae bacterium]MDK1118202.1 PilZ domain-containing protein [Anaerolineae bacterium]